MRVLLISENRCRENLVPWPIGPACVASAARARGHEVRGLDLMFSEDAGADVAAAVSDFEPDVVGLSIRNIDNQDMHANEFFVPAAAGVVSALRSATDAPIVLGGAGFTIFPLECLDYFDLEMGIVGEGEESFAALLDALESGGEPAEQSVPGLAFRRGGVRWVNPPGPYLDYAKMPEPDREAFSVERYNWTPGQGPPFVANVQSRRGCRMRCIYCSSPTVEGRVVRCRDPRAVANELESLEKDHGIKTVVFADSNFNHPAEYAKELCELIAAKRLALMWACGVNPHWHDPALYSLMREAGCFAVSLGNESGSEPTLTSLRKEFTKEDVRASALAIKAEGMLLHCFLLLGGPDETRMTVDESVRLMDELEPDAVRVTVGIRIFPGCELEGIAAANGIIEEGQDLLDPAFYLEPELAPWLYEYMSATCGTREGWFI
ncbi:MAG: B12-binding domain-containing radical SAM protein [Candidatus Geothermincolia bacterium]